MDVIEGDVEWSRNPLDVVEGVASANAWSFDRVADEEVAVGVRGHWAEYQLSVAWMPQVETFHIACSFETRIPAGRLPEVLKLLNQVNEQLWVGHFHVWPEGGIVMYRHAVLLAGGAAVSPHQCEALLSAAVQACERYYQAFQFVVWAGKPAREAIDMTLFETAGEA